MSWIDLSALWKIIVFGLLAGAGLPAVFALGLHFIGLGAKTPQGATVAAGGAGEAASKGSGGTEGGERIFVGGPGAVIAAVCFAIFLAGIAFGIYFIVSGS